MTLDHQRLCKRSINCRWKVALTNRPFYWTGLHIHFHRAALITSTGCISGNCIENTVANAEWNIALSTPAFSVGGYLGSAGQLAGFNAQGTAVTFYDATGTTILGVINPVGIDPNSNTGFFGFQSDGALISFIRIDPNGSQSSVWLELHD